MTYLQYLHSFSLVFFFIIVVDYEHNMFNIYVYTLYFSVYSIPIILNILFSYTFWNNAKVILTGKNVKYI